MQKNDMEKEAEESVVTYEKQQLCEVIVTATQRLAYRFECINENVAITVILHVFKCHKQNYTFRHKTNKQNAHSHTRKMDCFAKLKFYSVPFFRCLFVCSLTLPLLLFCLKLPYSLIEITTSNSC